MALRRPNRLQAIIWTNADPINWRIYAALWGDKLHTVTTMVGVNINCTQLDLAQGM